MPKRGRKYQEAASKIDRQKYYTRAEAIKLLKETAFTKFDPTVEVHFRLGVDPAMQISRSVASSYCPMAWARLFVFLFLPRVKMRALPKRQGLTLLPTTRS